MKDIIDQMTVSGMDLVKLTGEGFIFTAEHEGTIILDEDEFLNYYDRSNRLLLRIHLPTLFYFRDQYQSFKKQIRKQIEEALKD